MGKSSSPKPPKAPDPGELIDAQSQANRYNTTTPWGSATWVPGATEEDPWSYQISMSPEQQQLMFGQQAIQGGLLNAGMGMLGSLPNNLNFNGLPGQVTGIDQSGLPQLNPGQGIPSVDQFGAERQKVEDALYGRATARLDPRFAQERERLDTNLVNRGIPVSSEAYGRAMGDFDRSRNDAYSSAMNDAILAGGGEHSRLFGMGLAGQGQGFQQNLAARQGLFGEGMANAGLQNQGRQQGVAERTALYQTPYASLAAILGQSSPQMPNMPSPQPIDVMDAYGMNMAQQNANYQNQLGQNQATMGGLFGLGAAGLQALPFFF